MSVWQPWNLFFFAGFVFYIAIRGRFASRTKANVTVRTQDDGLEKALRLAVIVASLVLPALYLFTPLVSFADYSLPPWSPWFGAPVMVAALWLFWRAHADLGLNWSVTLEVREGHKLVRHGVYRRVRHPMYSAIWLFCVAQGMLLENWLAGWGAAAAFACMYFVRVPKEERLMQAHFCDDYDDYAASTGRLFPRLRG